MSSIARRVSPPPTRRLKRCWNFPHLSSAMQRRNLHLDDCRPPSCERVRSYDKVMKASIHTDYASTAQDLYIRNAILPSDIQNGRQVSKLNSRQDFNVPAVEGHAKVPCYTEHLIYLHVVDYVMAAIQTFL